MLIARSRVGLDDAEVAGAGLDDRAPRAVTDVTSPDPVEIARGAADLADDDVAGAALDLSVAPDVVDRDVAGAGLDHTVAGDRVDAGRRRSRCGSARGRPVPLDG